MRSEQSDPQASDLPYIQGGIIGFNKDFQRLVFVDFPNADTTKKYIRDAHHLLANARSVLDFNHLYEETVSGDGVPGARS
jgi:hypothetical protein